MAQKPYIYLRIYIPYVSLYMFHVCHGMIGTAGGNLKIGAPMPMSDGRAGMIEAYSVDGSAWLGTHCVALLWSKPTLNPGDRQASNRVRGVF